MSVIVVLCLVLLAYTYLGYPLVIGMLARLSPRPLHTDSGYKPLVSVCIPAYNVAAYLDAQLKSLVEQDYPAHKLEILV
jgi:poly-beta-1,6-N-acetyl-D-glucosamine synthase